MDLKKSEGGGGITRLLPENYGAIKKVTEANDSEMNIGCYASVMASVPQSQPEKEAAFSDLLTSVLSPAEAAEHAVEAATEEAADLSALDGLNLDFPPLNANNSNNYSSVSEVVAAAIMATSEDTQTHQNFTSGTSTMEDDHKVSAYGMARSYHHQQHHHYGAYNLHNSESASAASAASGLDDNSSLCSSPSPPSSRQHFYHYQGSFYGHHQPLQPHPHSHFTRPADKAATLHVVVNSGSNPSARQRSMPTSNTNPVHSSNSSSEGSKPQQQQLLLMRVSSVKSAPKDQNSSNNNSKKDNESSSSALRTNNEDIHQVHQPGMPTTDYGPPPHSHHHGLHLHHHLQQQPDLADQLLQQCLVPVVPNPRELTGGLWFRCRLCSRVELTSKLSAHARQYHHTDHVTDCISSLDQQQQQQNGGHQQDVSPSWCNNEASGGHGGAFPTDLEDVTLSSPTTSTLKNSGFEGGAAGGTNQSSSCSPPSGVTDLTPLNPQDHFDPDFDVVDDIKFIDSLIRTMPEDQQHNDGHYSGKSNNNGLEQGQQHQQQQNVIYGETTQGALGTPTTSSSSMRSPPTTTGSTTASAGTTKSSSKKSTPQFRWRRRKRRSKAQYPEMSRYLLPIDDGEEVQHLGRTLECTLCGLRGKRCHLTLHFKAKHNEVIDLAGVQNSRKQTNKQVQPPQPKAGRAGPPPPLNQPPDLCWQPPLPPPPAPSSLRMNVEAEVKIVSPPPPGQSAANGGHLSMNEASSVSSNVNDNESATVQGTSERIVRNYR